MATESLSNSQLMNILIRGGKLPKRQEEAASSELTPEKVIADIAKLVEELPDDEVELFRDQAFAALYGELDNAGATA